MPAPLSISRQHFRLSFSAFGRLSPGRESCVMLLRTLVRGEVFAAYLFAGYPSMEIPEEASIARAAFETELFRVGCLECSLLSPPAGLVTAAATALLRVSGFLEDSDEQKDMLEAAAFYARTSEARGDSLIMATYGRYGLEDLRAMTNPEWSRLLYCALLYQNEVCDVDAPAFLLGKSSSRPKDLAAQSDPGLSREFINGAFGLDPARASIAGGGVLTAADGLQTWGEAQRT